MLLTSGTALYTLQPVHTVTANQSYFQATGRTSRVAVSAKLCSEKGGKQTNKCQLDQGRNKSTFASMGAKFNQRGHLEKEKGEFGVTFMRITSALF